MTTRVGLGVDVHAFGGDGPLVLGGVTVASTGGLAGHSDADVVTHAVCDALLGAAGKGDLGRHFPSSDPQWAGVSSQRFLAAVHDLLVQDRIRVVNVDVVICAQRPRLAGHTAAMAEAMEKVLHSPGGTVHVKATTTDHLGAVGRGEGIAAQAVALVEKTDAPA